MGITTDGGLIVHMSILSRFELQSNMLKSVFLQISYKCTLLRYLNYSYQIKKAPTCSSPSVGNALWHRTGHW